MSREALSRLTAGSEQPTIVLGRQNRTRQGPGSMYGMSGERPGIRTLNLVIKSHLLCR
jgi:hypothetical protein